MTRLSKCAVTTTMAVACAMTMQAQQPGPQQAPRFRSAVDVVQVDVGVVDRDKRPVTGLSAADFTLLENGKPQDIVAFAEVRVPDTPKSPAPWMRSVSPDVRSNDLGDGRLFAIVMDDATMPPDPQITANAKRIGQNLVAGMGPDDLAAVIFVNDVRSSVDFTNDRGRLLKAVNAFSPGFAYVSPDPQTDSQHYFASIRTLGLVSARLTHVPQRRKAVIYVSTGVPVDTVRIRKAGVLTPLPAAQAAVQSVPVVVRTMDEPTSTDLNIALSDLLEQRPQEAYGAAMQEALIRAQYGNVNIYSIDPSGLGGMESYLQSRSRITTTGTQLLTPADTRSVTTGFSLVTQVDAISESRLRRDYLRAVSEDSGGRSIQNTNSFEAGVTRILEDNSAYYLVGYQSAAGPGDKTVRRVSVHMNRTGLNAVTRNAYSSQSDGRHAVAPGSDPGPGLAAALADVLPNPGVTLRAVSAAFAIPGGRAGLAVAVGVSQPVIGDAGARVNEELSVFATAFAPDGTPKAWFRQSVRLALRAGLSEPAAYEVLARLDLDPGQYQVRLAAHSTMTGKTGSVYFDVEVPAFARESLQLSGVALSIGDPIATTPSENVGDLLPVVPTSRRSFTADETVNGFLRIYQSPSRTPGPVSMTGTITDGMNRVLQRSALLLTADKFNAGQADYGWMLPLSGLAPGEYLLTMAAAQGGKTVHRDVRFRVQ